MDYCTGFFEGWLSKCCGVHDIAYTGVVDKVLADQNLFDCVLSSGDGWLGVISVPIAAIMYIGVRLFGKYFYKKSV